jgi:hypothetical protein
MPFSTSLIPCSQRIVVELFRLTIRGTRCLVWPPGLYIVSYDNNAGPLLDCSAQELYGMLLNDLRTLGIKMRNDPATQ